MADLTERSGRGRGRPFEKGVSGNPGGRPKGDATVKELARAHTVEAIETLVAMLNSERTRVAAAEALLSRGGDAHSACRDRTTGLVCGSTRCGQTPCAI
jgi:hypothetical protein